MSLLPFAAVDAQLLYAAPSHLVCTISGYRQYLQLGVRGRCVMEGGLHGRQEVLRQPQALRQEPAVPSLHSDDSRSLKTDT
jgi:hypothetical protein